MEWNNGALFIIFLVFFIPIVIIYTLLKVIIKNSSFLNSSIKKEKKERIVVYIFIEIGLIILSIGLTIGVFSLINFINGGRGVLG